MSVTIANPTATSIAISFVVVTFVLLLLLLITWCICCCWRYKLHKRKQELKSRDLEQGIYSVKPRQCCGCCGCGYKCCGCWSYTCRSCNGCCGCDQSSTVDQVIPATAIIAPTGPTCNSGCNGGGAQYAWNKDVYVYNTSAPKIATTSCSPCSQSANRWSSSSDGRLVLNGGGVVSRITPGSQAYGGIYPTVPIGVSNGDQFQLRVGK